MQNRLELETVENFPGLGVSEKRSLSSMIFSLKGNYLFLVMQQVGENFLVSWKYFLEHGGSYDGSVGVPACEG